MITLELYRGRMSGSALRVLVLPDQLWAERDASIQAIAEAGLGVLNIPEPREAKAVCASIVAAELAPPLVIVAFGESCQLLPAVALSLRTQHRSTVGYVLIDPDAPPSSDTWPEAPVVVVSTTEQAGVSLRGWEVVAASTSLPSTVAEVVLRLLSS